MSAFHTFPLVFALALSAAAFAQEAPVPAPAKPAAAAMPHDCPMSMAGREKDADKPAAMPMPEACPMATAASPAKTKAKPSHDHSRFHKLM